MRYNNDIEIGPVTIKWDSIRMAWVYPGGHHEPDKKKAIRKATNLSQQVARWEQKKISDRKRAHLRQPIVGYSKPRY